MEHSRIQPMAGEGWRALIRSATRAPSSHNTQPWRFRVEDGGVTVYADPERRLPVNDPADRELTISGGCALMNLRVAAAAAGYAYRLESLPQGERASCLARLVWQDGEPDAEEVNLAPAIDRRWTCRQLFRPTPIAQEAVEAFMATADQEGARLQLVEPGEMRLEVARLVAQGDALQWRDREWRAELAGWIRSRRGGDGLTVPAAIAPFARAAVRGFDMGRRLGAHDRKLAEDAPRLIALCTEGDGRLDWLRAGQALERVLLAASQLGLQASYLNQPIQVASLRPRLRAALGDPGHPQVLLRLGYPQREPPAPTRRPVDDVIDPAGG